MWMGVLLHCRCLHASRYIGSTRLLWWSSEFTSRVLERQPASAPMWGSPSQASRGRRQPDVRFQDLRFSMGVSAVAHGKDVVAFLWQKWLLLWDQFWPQDIPLSQLEFKDDGVFQWKTVNVDTRQCTGTSEMREEVATIIKINSWNLAWEF